MKQSRTDDQAIVIKKYANRRLYNTHTSSYITLEHLAQMTRDGVDFQVLDAKSGVDITHSILTQIIMDEEAGGEQMLPTSFLRQLIAMYGNSMQAMLPGYLEASMEHFRDNQAKMRKALEDSIGANPLAQLAQRNMEIFQKAASAFVPGVARSSHEEENPASGEEDLATLRAQMAELQKKLDALGK